LLLTATLQTGIGGLLLLGRERWLAGRDWAAHLWLTLRSRNRNEAD
jgi:hypothetical protein